MPRGGNKKSIAQFLDDILDEKLENFAASEKTIKTNKKYGYRLDHQGVNNSDGLERLYIQPVSGPNTTISKSLNSDAVIAQCHAWPTSKAESVRKALKGTWRSTLSSPEIKHTDSRFLNRQLQGRRKAHACKEVNNHTHVLIQQSINEITTMRGRVHLQSLLFI